MATKIFDAKNPDAKNPDEALFPSARPFTYGGKTYQIMPMNDIQLIQVADALSNVSSLFGKLGELTEQKEDGQKAAAVLVSAAPAILSAILPESNKIISASLGITPEEVSSMRLAERIEVLRVILEVEDLPLLIKNIQALRAIFPSEAPTEAGNQDLN